MRDERVEKVAHILTEYSIPLEPGKTAVVQGTTLAEPLMLAIFERLVKRGVHAYLRPAFPHADRIFFEHASDAQLGWLWEPDRWHARLAQVEGSISDSLADLGI